MDKIDSRTLPVEALNERRRRAVKVRLEGMPLQDVAVQCELSRTTVIAAVKAFHAGGWKAVMVERPGRPVGTGRTLTTQQEREVQHLIRDPTPDQLNMVYALWTRQAVAELIRDRFGIDLPVRTMGLYLSRWGFTPQRPIKRALEQRPELIDAWLKETYPALEAKAKAERAVIFFGDEAAVKEDSVWIRGYAPKGQTPVLSKPTRWDKLSMISALSAKGEVAFQIIDGGFNAERFIGFLEALISDAPRKIILIVDNLKVHKAALVKDWLRGRNDRIELVFLPPYQAAEKSGKRR